jgi:predicted Fe-Mo cluster-binding NifX family protein
MKKKIAVPVTESGNLDSHFGHCRYFAIYEAEGSEIQSDLMVQPPPHEPGVLPQWLANLEVTDVLAGGMGNRALQLFNQQNIKVYTGAPAMQAKELVNGFLTNSVKFNGNHCDH